MDSRVFKELGYNPKKAVRDTPKFSSHHPMIPQRYVPQWQLDMKNRKQIIMVAMSYSYKDYLLIFIIIIPYRIQLWLKTLFGGVIPVTFCVVEVREL